MSLLNIAESLSRLPRIGSLHPRILDDEYTDHPGVARLRRQLADEGFKLIANGAYSIVLKHKDWPGRVLKVSTRHGMEDKYGDVVYDAGVAYWQYCLRNQGKKGKHLPVVYATGKLMFAGSAMPYVWMKAYTPGDYLIRLDLANEFGWEYDEVSKARQRRVHESVGIDSESWFTILQDALKFGGPDFHENNMMYDPELETFIITDPVY